MQRANHKAGCVPSAFQYVTLKTSSVRHAASQPSREVLHDFFDHRALSAQRAIRYRHRELFDRDRPVCDGAVRANTGVTLTLGNPLPRNNYLAINLLAQGRTAGQALNELIANDADNAFRQIALVDRENTAVAHTGANLRKWAGHRVGNGYVVFGDTLAGQSVLDAMAAGSKKRRTRDSTSNCWQRLKRAAMRAGIVGGKGRLPERGSDGAVGQPDLQRSRPARRSARARDRENCAASTSITSRRLRYYDERARNPRNAIPAMEFADMLKKQQAKETT